MKRAEKKGFTLIELIMVIVILGILAAVAIPKFVNLSDVAGRSACEGIRGSIASAASIYYANEAAHQQANVTFPTADGVALQVEGWTGTWADNDDCPGGTADALNYVQTSGTVTCDVHST